MALDGTIMAAPVNIKTDSIEVGEARRLFGPVAIYLNTYRYDVSADGQRFLVALPAGGKAATEPVTVVQNWQAGLKK